MAAKQPPAPNDRPFVRCVLIVLGLASLVFLLWQLRTLLLMLFGAVVIASIFRTVGDWVCRHTRLPGGVATGLAIFIVLVRSQD
jgi:predicted PurR-regulated permease PerM